MVSRTSPRRLSTFIVAILRACAATICAAFLYTFYLASTGSSFAETVTNTQDPPLADTTSSLDAVNDGFTDSERTNGADALDLSWLELGTPSLAVVDDSAGIATGNALQQTSSKTFQGIIASAPWFHLGDGDSLTLSFDWRFTGTTGLNEAAKFRFGLHSSGATPPKSGNATVYKNDRGYFAATNPGLASDTGTTLHREPSGDGILGGADIAAVGTAGASISAGTTKHSATMTIKRTGTSLFCSTSIDGLAAASGTDATPVSYVFDEIDILMAGKIVPSPYLIDNVKLTYSTSTPVPPEGPPAGTWELVLDEQFNGTSLNTAIWSTGYRWKEIINKELQAMRPENVTVANGVCTILVEKRAARNVDMRDRQGKTMNYASGAITTYNKWAATYGYFEARIKLPAGKGTWPAFWLLPDRGASHDEHYRTSVGSKVWYPDRSTAPCPMGSEIDIFEHMGTWKNPATGLSKLHCNLIWGYPGSAGGYVNMNGVSGHYILQNPDTQFHNYGLYWEPGKVVFYIDGNVVMRREHQNVGVVPHYLLLNCALTTNDWTRTAVPIADIDATLPSSMVIDYVRVYSGTPSRVP